MKNTKQTLLSIAIIAALPFTANATQTVVETNTPAAVGANGTVKKAAATGPYQTATIGEHDDEHIATTAYVKGAYNDAIAAVNKVDDSKQVKLKNMQNNNPILPKVLSGSGFNGLADGVLLNGISQDEYAEVAEAVAYDLTGVHNNAAALNDTLISAETVMQWMREAGDGINRKQEKLFVDNPNIDEVHDIVYTAYGVGHLGSDFPSMTSQEASDLATQFDLDGASLISVSGVIRWMRDMGAELKGNTDAVATSLNNKRVTIYTTWGNDTSAATTQVALSNQ